MKSVFLAMIIALAGLSALVYVTTATPSYANGDKN